MANNPFAQTIESFLEFLKTVQKRAPLTIDHYRRYLRTFSSSSGISRLGDLDSRALERFEQNLRRGKLSSVTKNAHLSALRSFLRWLPESQRSMSPSDIHLNKIRYRRPSPTSNTAITKVLAAPDTMRRTDAISARDRALLELLYSSGLTISEIASLRTQNLHMNSRMLMVASPRQAIKLSLHATRFIAEYLRIRKDTNPFLFISHDRAQKGRTINAKISYRSIQRVVKKYGRLTGLPITARSLQQAGTMLIER